MPMTLDDVTVTEMSCPACSNRLVQVEQDAETAGIAESINMTFHPLVCPQPTCLVEFVHVFKNKEEDDGAG